MLKNNLHGIIGIAFLAFLLGCTPPPPRPVKVSLEELLMLETKYKYDSLTADSTYGYSQENPIKTAYHQNGEDIMGPFTQHFYLVHLKYLDGRNIQFKRMGSCCNYPSKHGIIGNTVPLDRYEVVDENSKDKKILYLNMYDGGDVYAPVGFQLKKPDLPAPSENPETP